MRLKFAAASATGRTRCGELADQKDERKPIARDQRPETSGRKMKERKVSYFSLLSSLARRSLVRRRLTFLGRRI